VRRSTWREPAIVAAIIAAVASLGVAFIGVAFSGKKNSRFDGCRFLYHAPRYCGIYNATAALVPNVGCCLP
jgi:hypothetical protein